MSDALWIIGTASLVAISCSLLGVWLILRKMAMLGDAISHAVLPGIVIAFLITSFRDNYILLVGAAIVGVLTTFLIEFFHQKARLQSDASIGITFTWLFAIGVILISVFAGQVDLDQECVLYGEIAYVPLESRWIIGTFDMGPASFWLLSSVLILNLAFIIFFFRELRLSTFDSGFSLAIGVSVGFWHYLLMGLVSLTTVASFESVGAILVLAFLVAPPATAYLLSKTVVKMLILSCIFGIIGSVFGYYLSVAINGSIAGAIATVLGIQFFVVFITQRIQIMQTKGTFS